MSRFPCFLDFEASSLSIDSYPIEVAWSLDDGSIESHLISPAGIAEWTDWSPVSAKIHNIPRETLLAEGKPPSWVCARMNEQLSGKVLYTDSVNYDGMWLAELFAVCPETERRFMLGSIHDLLGHPRRFAELTPRARVMVPGQHRAAWDVEFLLKLWKLAQE